MSLESAINDFVTLVNECQDANLQEKQACSTLIPTLDSYEDQIALSVPVRIAQERRIADTAKACRELLCGGGGLESQLPAPIIAAFEEMETLCDSGYVRANPSPSDLTLHNLGFSLKWHDPPRDCGFFARSVCDVVEMRNALGQVLAIPELIGHGVTPDDLPPEYLQDMADLGLLPRWSGIFIREYGADWRKFLRAGLGVYDRRHWNNVFPRGLILRSRDT